MQSVRIVLAALLLTTVAAVPVGTAHHCESDVYVFSSVRVTDPAPAGTPAAAYNGIVCDTAGVDDENADGRLITPGATHVLVRFVGTATCPGAVTLSGLGFAGESFPLTVAAGTTGAFCQSAQLPIPGGSAASGTLEVTVSVGAVSETVYYRTVA